MQKKVLMFLPLFCCFFSPALAADVELTFPVQNALANEKVKEALVENVALYWGDQQHPDAKNTYGEFSTSQRANALGKSKEEACQWALASALKSLQNRALREGGNAVVKIKSNLKNKELSSDSEYECLAGSMMVNVALKGTVVNLAK